MPIKNISCSFESNLKTNDMELIDELIKRYTEEAEDCEVRSKMFRSTRTFQENNKTIARQLRLTIIDLNTLKNKLCHD